MKVYKTTEWLTVNGLEYRKFLRLTEAEARAAMVTPDGITAIIQASGAPLSAQPVVTINYHRRRIVAIVTYNP